jgi:ParB-like chromosome segregation protein Spo0J
MANESDQAAVWASPSDLTPWVKNPKPIRPSDVREMGKSIRRFGFGAPIVARLANGEVIEGHLRLAAAIQLKLERVPVRYLDITEDEAHLLALAALKFEDRRPKDEEQIAEVLADLAQRNVDLSDGTSFADRELDKILGTIVAPGHSPQPTGKASTGLVYRIVVDCTDEAHQAELMERFDAEGIVCRPLMS